MFANISAKMFLFVALVVLVTVVCSEVFPQAWGAGAPIGAAIVLVGGAFVITS